MRIDVQVEMALPGEDVFAYLADLTNNPDWQSGVESTELVSGHADVVGATYEQVLDDGNKTQYVVTNIEPGRSITMRTEGRATVDATIIRTVQKLSDRRCRVRMELIGRVRGWRRIITPLLRRMIRSSIAADYRRLRRLLEPNESGET